LIIDSLYATDTVAQEGGGKWGHAPMGAGLGGTSTHFIQPFKNAVLSRNLNQKYAYKMHTFLKKLQNRRSIPPPDPRVVIRAY